MAHVENHLSIEDLAARYRACEDVCAARHTRRSGFWRRAICN
jgi:hypothetical protein